MRVPQHDTNLGRGCTLLGKFANQLFDLQREVRCRCAARWKGIVACALLSHQANLSAAGLQPARRRFFVGQS